MKRFQNELVELTRDCELGSLGERAVVTTVDARYMVLVFPNRPSGSREVRTGTDYVFLRTV